MQITCKCLNVMIYSRGSIIDNYDFKSKSTVANHPFFKENIACVELDKIHKEHTCLLETETLGEWVVHYCMNCELYTHAHNTASTAMALINRNMIMRPQDISYLKDSKKYSHVYRIVIHHKDEDKDAPATVEAVGALQQQLNLWLQNESVKTEERIRQYSDEQYAALDMMHIQAQRDHYALSRILSKVSRARKDKAKNSKANAQPANRPHNFERKTYAEADGLFYLDDMDEIVDINPTDDTDEHTDTDESASHDEGIHIPRSTDYIYAKSLPVTIPRFPQRMDSMDSPDRPYIREALDPDDIAASMKALAKSVHGDAIFGDLPRPRFSSKI